MYELTAGQGPLYTPTYGFMNSEFATLVAKSQHTQIVTSMAKPKSEAASVKHQRLSTPTAQTAVCYVKLHTKHKASTTNRTLAFFSSCTKNRKKLSSATQNEI